MAHAEILIEDEGDLVAVRINYTNGADPTSRAHQLANIVRQHMDQLMTQESEPEEVLLVPAGAAVPGNVQESSRTSPGQTLVD